MRSPGTLPDCLKQVSSVFAATVYPRPSRHPSGPNHPSVSTSYVAVGAWGLQPLVAMSSFYVGCGDSNSGPTVSWQVPYPPSHLSNPRNGLSLAIWNFLNQVRLRASTHHLPRSAFLGKGCSEPPVDSTTRYRPSENAPRGCWEPRTQINVGCDNEIPSGEKRQKHQCSPFFCLCDFE